MAWKRVGSLQQLEQFAAGAFPFEKFEYGMKYNHGNGAIHPVVISGWNRGVRVSVAINYPQGDNVSGMTFGTTVFAKGLDDCNDGNWHHQYYQGGRPGGWSNGVVNPELYVRRLACAWTQVGNLSQLEGHMAGAYPTTDFEYGIKYNHGMGAIHKVVTNGWDRGLRVSVVPDYPQGDALRSMTFGTAVFAKGLDGLNDGQWHHQYYQLGKPTPSSNGVVNPELFVRRLVDFEQAQAENAQLREAAAAQASNLGEAQNRNADLEAQLEQAQRESVQLRAAGAAQAENLVEVQRRNADLEAQIAQLQSAAAEQVGELQALRAKNTLFREEFQRQQAFIQASL